MLKKKILTLLHANLAYLEASRNTHHMLGKAWVEAQISQMQNRIQSLEKSKAGDEELRRLEHTLLGNVLQVAATVELQLGGEQWLSKIA